MPKIVDKTLKAIQNFGYEMNWNVDSSDDYYFEGKLLEEIFNSASWPFKVDLNKLSYYTRNHMIPAPKRIGITSKLGGSVGKYKVKVLTIIWYIRALNQRGIYNHDEIKNHIYTYFSDELPPKPVDDTPTEERIIYTLRLNKEIPFRLFELEDYNLNVVINENEVSVILCKKVTFYWNEHKNEPISQKLIPMRNISRAEMNFILALRKDKEFLKKEGLKIYQNRNGKILEENLLDLFIYDKYPLKALEDFKTSYKDLISKDKKYDCL